MEHVIGHRSPGSLDNLKIGDGLKEDDLVEYKVKRQGFQRCCVELARRAWVVCVVEDDLDGLDEIHRCVMRVIEMAEDCNVSVEVLDGALYELAVALGMPACTDCNPGRSRMLAMHHIVSTIQCGVMMMSTRESNSMGATCHMEGLDGGNVEKDLSENILRLGLAIGMDSGEKNAVHILRRVATEIEKLKGELPPGFFDVMVQSDAHAWNEEQMRMLNEISDQLNAETRLRRTMMVDRALATLKSFSSSQLVRENPGLMNILDSKMQEALKIMEMICEGDVAGVEDAFAMTKGEIVSLLMESKHEGTHDARVKTVRIGHVPDRGGRPEGQSRAAGLMPEWQARKKSSGGPGHWKKKHNKSQGNKSKNTANKA
eukprot:jgi/Picre1/31605/NNA_006957.t1